MKTLLIAFGGETYPIGLADIYHYLKMIGEDVDFVHLYDDYSILDGLSCEPDFVGISVSYMQLSAGAFKLVGLLRKRWKKCKVVLGGKHFSDDILPMEAGRLCSMADFIVIGEGEYAMRDIVTGKAVEGIVYGCNLSEDDYRAVPFPDEEFVGRYFRTNRNTGVVFSRGCAFNCVFCRERRIPVIRKDPADAVRHLADKQRWLGHDSAFIYDDIFTLDKGYLYEFRDEVQRQKLNVNIKCMIHAKCLDEEAFGILPSIGVNHLCLGAESGDDEILKLINKKATVEDFRRIKGIVGDGMILHCLWMIGNIGETDETMRKTVELSREIGNNLPWFSYALPFPGTLFWKKVGEYGSLTFDDIFRFSWRNTNIAFVPFGTTKERMAFWREQGVSGWRRTR